MTRQRINRKEGLIEMINKQLTQVQKADSTVYETPSWLGRHIFGLLLAATVATFAGTITAWALGAFN
ncbi:hypothetical protein ACLOBX_05315 [Limosilactobacillus mucosae]|uniref:hypothetical protein n=1 Tax=Limosilactobacillus mucosae TaxID=97478 RepID=UPI003EBB24FC